LEAARYWMRRNVGLTRIIGTSFIAGLIAIGAIVYLWQQATRETRRAEQSMKTAIAHSQTLRAVIDRFVEGLKRLERNPATTTLQLQLLTDLNDAYDQLIKQTEPDLELLRAHAVCLFKLGLVQKQFHQIDDSVFTIEKAEAMFLQLAHLEPTNPKHWFDVYHCRNALRRTREALQAIEIVCALDTNETFFYSDALANTKLRLAEDLLMEPNSIAQALQLCEEATIIAEKNLRSDPSDWRSWKKPAEVLGVQAKISVLSGDDERAMVQFDQSNQAYRQVLRLLPQDREVLRLMWTNTDLKLSLEFRRNDWNAATKTAEMLHDLALEYQAAGSGNFNHFRQVTFSLAALVSVAYMDERHDLVVAYGVQWRAAADAWVDAYPDSYPANLERAMCYATLHHLDSDAFSASKFPELASSFQQNLKENSPGELEWCNRVIVLYLLGEWESSRDLLSELAESETTRSQAVFKDRDFATLLKAKLGLSYSADHVRSVVEPLLRDGSNLDQPIWRNVFLRHLLGN
jgi:tetratricopeptide (TPR) repeat protein